MHNSWLMKIGSSTTLFTLSSRFPWEDAKASLEEKGWFVCPSLLSENMNAGLLESFLEKLEKDQFDMAQVGKNLERSLEKRIRHSETSWIESWHENSQLRDLNQFFGDLSHQMNQHFYLNIKRWESQMAYYPEGGFYKKHLDQLRSGENRLMTCIFYLNNCERGGELVIYDRDDMKKKAATIKASKGTCVLFFSSQIFHEVLPAYSPRFSFTTWLRHDQDSLLS